MKRSLILLGLLMLLLMACNPKSQSSPETNMANPTEANETALQAEINTLMSELTASAEKMSTEALEKYLSDEPWDSFYMGAKEYSKAELLLEVKKAYEPFTKQSLKTTKSTNRVLSPDYVLWKGIMESTATQKDGKTADMKLSETWLWHKTDKGWKVIHYDESW